MCDHSLELESKLTKIFFSTNTYVSDVLLILEYYGYVFYIQMSEVIKR